MQLREIVTGSEKKTVSQKTKRGDPSTPGTKKHVHSSQKGFILVLTVLLGISFCITSVYAETVTGTPAGMNVYVSSITYNPAVFFTGDKGTVTAYVTNGNNNQTVSVNHASFGDNNIQRTSGTYDASSVIGPLQTRSYTFSVIANGIDGVYYPTFSLSNIGTLSLWQQADVHVDNTPLMLTVTGQPDTFSPGSKDTISVQIANPRTNEVNNVILDVSGTDATIMPVKNYIGSLAPGESTTVNFTVIADQPTTLNLKVNYNNGDNVHTVSTSLPVTFVVDKKEANPVITNIKVTTENGIYHVTGDITNAGLVTANGVSVTSLSPAVPLDPFRSYIIGALKPDDFGSFEVTFSTDSGITTVPLQLAYKDKDGNVITSQQQVSLAGVSTTTPDKAQLGILPVIGGIVIVTALAGGGYLYVKKRKNR
jgi:hypothetical protein